MSSREQYKALLTSTKQELRKEKKIGQLLADELAHRDEVIARFGSILHTFKTTPWWKFRTFYKSFKDLRK